jgi:hypothetical protein
MPDINVRVTLQLTSWHEWQPFGLAESPDAPQFGITVHFCPAGSDTEQLLVLETKSSLALDLSTNTKAVLLEAYELATIAATARLNEMPYQLPIF